MMLRSQAKCWGFNSQRRRLFFLCVHKEGLVHREVQLAGRGLLLFFSAGQKTKGTLLLGNLADNTRSNIICNFCHPIVSYTVGYTKG